MREGVSAEVGRIAPIEGLRGVAVLWVIAFHYVVVRDAVGIRDPWIEALARVPALDVVARNGYLGVDLFFLISGFLLALPWFLHARAGIAPPSTAAFYARRVRRIVPAYYLQLLLLFLVVMPLLHGLRYWRSDLYVYLWNGVAHGLFVHNSTPLTGGSLGVNGALWTLAVEAQFYVLLPLAAPLFVRAPLRTFAAAAIAALAWQWGARHGFEALVGAQLRLGAHWQWSEEIVRRLLTMQLPEYLAHFALGIALGRTWLRLRDRREPAWTPHARLAAALLAAAVLYASLTGLGTLRPEYVRDVSAYALGVLLFVAATSRSAPAGAVLGRGPLAFAGRVSYSAYLYHLPLLALWNVYARDADGWLGLPAFATLLFATAWLSWRYVEQPFLRSRRISPTLAAQIEPAIAPLEPRR